MVESLELTRLVVTFATALDNRLRRVEHFLQFGWHGCRLLSRG
jgi:hypothetical protein